MISETENPKWWIIIKIVLDYVAERRVVGDGGKVEDKISFL